MKDQSMVNRQQFEAVYEKGIAVGFSDLRTDTMTFRFRDEVFTFPNSRAVGIYKFNGYFYEAPINKVRALEAELAALK